MRVEEGDPEEKVSGKEGRPQRKRKKVQFQKYVVDFVLSSTVREPKVHMSELLYLVWKATMYGKCGNVRREGI